MVQLRAMRAEANQPVGAALRVLSVEEKVEAVKRGNQRSLSLASHLGKRKPT